MRPPISACRRRAVRILATRKRRGKKPQGCWPNAMTGAAAHAGAASSVRARGGRTACSATLKAMHAAQPMRLYQR